MMRGAYRRSRQVLDKKEFAEVTGHEWSGDPVIKVSSGETDLE